MDKHALIHTNWALSSDYMYLQMSFRIPKIPKNGMDYFLAFKSEGQLVVNFEIKVFSNTCPAQVVSADTTCQVKFVSFNGKEIMDNVDRLVEMTKYNLDCSDSPMGVKLKRPKISIKGCYWLSHTNLRLLFGMVSIWLYVKDK